MEIQEHIRSGMTVCTSHMHRYHHDHPVKHKLLIYNIINFDGSHPDVSIINY